jgi:hypothetical protein
MPDSKLSLERRRLRQQAMPNAMPRLSPVASCPPRAGLNSHVRSSTSSSRPVPRRWWRNFGLCRDEIVHKHTIHDWRLAAANDIHRFADPMQHHMYVLDLYDSSDYRLFISNLTRLFGRVGQSDTFSFSDRVRCARRDPTASISNMANPQCALLISAMARRRP